MRPLLVGEANPYGGDPDYALFPDPENSAGGRLCFKILGLSRREYLDRFDRANLCPTRWSARAARAAATAIREESAGKRVVVLLGAKVCAAFGFDYRPFTTFGVLATASLPRFVLLPHPSGRCRLWNEPGSLERARAALRHADLI